METSARKDGVTLSKLDGKALEERWQIAKRA